MSEKTGNQRLALCVQWQSGRFAKISLILVPKNVSNILIDNNSHVNRPTVQVSRVNLVIGYLEWPSAVTAGDLQLKMPGIKDQAPHPESFEEGDHRNRLSTQGQPDQDVKRDTGRDKY